MEYQLEVPHLYKLIRPDCPYILTKAINVDLINLRFPIKFHCIHHSLVDYFLKKRSLQNNNRHGHWLERENH